MKNLLRTALTALGLMATSVAVLAEDWTPPGPIEMMIAFRAGGSADAQARFIAQELEARLGWSIAPKQVTGKGGLRAAIKLKDAPKDGTAIAFIITETVGYNAAAAKDLGVTPADFTGLTTTASFQMGIVARVDSGYATFADVIAAAKIGTPIRFGVMSARLGELAYLIAQENDVDFDITVVQGGQAVLDAIMVGNMDVGFAAGIQRKGVAAGDLVNLASAMSSPLAQSPDAPMLNAFGVPYHADGQLVFVGPAGMDPAATAAISKAIAEIVSDGDTDAGGLVIQGFGGPTLIMGKALDAALAGGFEDARALIAQGVNQ